MISAGASGRADADFSADASALRGPGLLAPALVVPAFTGLSGFAAMIIPTGQRILAAAPRRQLRESGAHHNIANDIVNNPGRG
jgi:hypothetical protein